MTGVSSQLTRRLTVTASVGVGFVNAWNNGLAVPLLPGNTFQTGAATSWQGSAIVNYLLLNTTNIFVSAAHLIVPTSFGQLQKTTTAGFGIAQDINPWSRLTFFADYAHTESGINLLTSDADFFSAQVAYSYQLARDWRSRLSYTYRQRDDDTGTAQSSTVLLSLVYNFNLIGNPSVFDPVEQQRALIRQQRAVGEVFPTLQ